MKNIRVIFLLLMSIGFFGYSFGQNDLQKKANELYSKGDYTGASELYEKIIKTYGVAPELYYNLGNTYYKMGETGRSILNYEKALRLKPMYHDARYNLDMAQQKVIDNIVQVPPFFILRWLDILMKLLTSNQWLFAGFVTFIITIIAALFFIFGFTLNNRKISFYLATIFLSITVVTLVFSAVRKNQQTQHNEAIIMTGVVTVKSSPDRSGTDLFQLHEGTKVKVKSQLGSWFEVVLGNGNIGWLESKNIEQI